MERIKDITKMKILSERAIIRLKEKNSAILLLDEKRGDGVEYAEIVAFHKSIEDLEVGDIVLDFGKIEVFEWKKEKYSVVPRHQMRVVVSRDNFTFTNTVDS